MQSQGAGKWSIVAILGAAQFIIVIDTTIMNVSISNIVADLNTTVTGVQGAVTLYTLVMASFMITGAKVGGIWGRKRAFAIGTILFAIGSGLTGFARGLLMLTLGWSIIEGFGSALMMPALWSLTTTNYSGRDRAVAMAIIAGIAGGAAALGPIIGGAITSSIGWRWAFRLEVIIAIAVLACIRLIKEDPVLEKPRLDFTGMVLSVSGMAAVVFGILRMSSWGLIKPRASAPFTFLGISPSFWIIAGGLVVLAVFAAWERKLYRGGKEPLMRVSLLRKWQLSSGLYMYTLNNIVTGGLLFALPLYMQKVLGLDALATGIGLLPLSLTILLISFVAPRLAKRFYPKYIVMVGTVLSGAGCLVLSATVPKEDPTRTSMILGLTILGIGIGCIISQLSNLVMSSAPPDAVNDASALNTTFASLGSSIGTALLGAVLIAGLAFGIVAQLDGSTVLNAEQKQQIEASVREDVQVVSSAELDEALTEFPAQLRQEVIRINDNANKKAFSWTLFMGAIIAGLAFILSLFMPKVKLQ
jgi:MFS family permease